MWPGRKITNSVLLTKIFVFIFSLKLHDRKIFVLVFKRMWINCSCLNRVDWTQKWQSAGLLRYPPVVLVRVIKAYFFSRGATAPSGPGPSHYRGFAITLRHTIVGRIPLEEWSARRRGLYLTTHNTHNIQISMHPVRFETTISASEQPQTYSLDRAATGIGFPTHTKCYDTN
jgi:hypothetical protein